MSVHANANLAVVEIDGREVRVTNRPQCRVCRSRHRAVIERGLIQGLPPRSIVYQLTEPSDVSARNIREHRRRGHVPVDHDAIEQMQADFRSGPTAQLAFDATVEQAATEHIARVVLALVYERLATREITPTLKDGLRAARVLANAERGLQRLKEAKKEGERIEAHRMLAIDHLLTLVREIGGADLYCALLTTASNDETLGAVLLDRRLSHHRGYGQVS
jgi:hypothetical protein